jgi:hypothetical protein
MALVDMCMYAAVLGATGEDPRPLTSNMRLPSYAVRQRVI